MNKILITDDILLKNGFERSDKDEYKKVWGDYKSYELWTEDKDPIKIDMSYKATNNNTDWNMHLDNERCETIGSADINYIEQFNLMMKIFESNYELKP